MSRRALGLLLALILLLTILPGCGHNAAEPVMAGEGTFGTDTSSAESEASGKETDTVPRGNSSSFSMPFNNTYGWDPFSCIGMENRAVMGLIYEGLFTLNNSFQAEPWLCKSYTLSEDGYTYTLELQDAVFSTGKALTADDVVYSLGQAASSDLYNGRFDDVSSYYAAGATTVIIQMSRPNDRLPCLLTFPIIPAFAPANAPVGTGPFARNDQVLTVNEYWWQGVENLHFNTVYLYSSISSEDTRDNFEIDNVHFIYNNPSSVTSAEYHSDYELWNSRGTTMQYVGFNFANGVFQDSQVRAAVTHAINRSYIAESVYHNFADAASLPVAPSSVLYDQSLASRYAYTSASAAMEELKATSSFYLPEGFDPTGENEAAVIEEVEGEESEDELLEDEFLEDEYYEEENEDIMAEEGEEDDSEETGRTIVYNRITLVVRSGNLRRVAAAKLVAQNLSDAGFTVTIRELEGDEFLYAIRYMDDWDLFYGEVTLQPDFDLRPLLMGGGSLSYGGFSGSDTLNTLLARSRENSGNSYDLYEHVMDNGYLCPVLFINNAVFTTRGVFTGLDPTPENLFYHITDIYVNHE